MALLSSSPSSTLSKKRQGVLRKRRSSSVFTILLLVLSQNVWNTLQCGSTSTNKNRPSVEDMGMSSTEFSESETRQQLGNNAIVQKKDTDENDKQLQKNVRACNDRLLGIIIDLCGPENFYAPGITEHKGSTRESGSLKEVLRLPSKRSSDLVSGEIMQRRLTRSLANECCKNSCTAHSMMKFCLDKTKISMTTTQRPELQMTTEEQSDFIEDLQESEPQLSPSSTEDPEPAIYYPLFHFIKFMHRQFGNKNPRLIDEMEVEDGDNQIDSQQQFSANVAVRELPIPQPRIQEQHSRSRSPPPPQGSQGTHSNNLRQYRSRERQRHKGTPSSIHGEITGGTKPGDSFVNSNTNIEYLRQGHGGHHHHYPNTINIDGGSGISDTKQLPLHIKNYFRHRQGEGQQTTRKSSTNVLTSTIPPDVTIIRFGPSTYDDIPYKKRK